MNKQPVTTSTYTPINEYDALMVTMPHEEPVTPSNNLIELRERVGEYIEMLEPRLQWIIHGIMNEGKSLQEIAEELAFTKTHIWRLRNQALEQLKELMSTDTTIRKAVRIANTWEQSASQWVTYMSGTPDISSAPSIEDMEAYVDAMIDIHQAGIETKNLELLYMRLGQQAIAMLRKYNHWDSGKMLSTLCGKHHDYGNAGMNRFGVYGCTVRIYDKVTRYRNLYERDATFESTYDTLWDIVGYSVMALMVLDGTFELESGDTDGTEH